ncbi:MAG: UDP-N-acetylmuramoyl-L-alanyl-D-glutamate--2,6-diaminopimelate ligase [Opitutales bacterium]|nr:UDP-N-acetylmuramoyl-L-alanyl-D-glutamate--2,6-diaminopimelate ligase [Opitutales bacterium]
MHSQSLGADLTLERLRDFAGLACRPEEVRPGSLFFAFEEFLRYNEWVDGKDWMDAAISAGAGGLVADFFVEQAVGRPEISRFAVPNPRRAFAAAARLLHGAPDEDLRPVGVTGTNGKSSIVGLIAAVGRRLEGRGGSLGTLGFRVNGEEIEPMDYTTDLAHENFRRMARFRSEGGGLLAMEVSSHALALDRVHGVHFAQAVFTNLSQDHLDFHGDMAAYRNAKARLFAELRPGAKAIINAMDAAADQMVAGTAATVWRFAATPAVSADFVATEVEATARGTAFTVIFRGARAPVRSALVGRFQIDNLLAAIAVGCARGHPLEAVAAAVSEGTPPPGRMEAHPLDSGAVGLVDYAHNPGGLENLLRTCRDLAPRRILLVFGCGGDRDRSKRPLMARIAENGADRVWVTSDNPRTEDPEAIIDDILAGLREPARAVREADRATAIRLAMGEAREGDLLVVAGKGHETYQIIGTRKFPFSDQDILSEGRG